MGHTSSRGGQYYIFILNHHLSDFMGLLDKKLYGLGDVV